MARNQAMAIYRSLGTQISRNSSYANTSCIKTRTFFTATTPPPTTVTTPSAPYLLKDHNYSRWVTPFRPVLLGPPRKLSQFAVPGTLGGYSTTVSSKIQEGWFRLGSFTLDSAKSRVKDQAGSNNDRDERGFKQDEDGRSILFSAIHVIRFISPFVLARVVKYEMYQGAFVGVVVVGSLGWVHKYLARKWGIRKVEVLDSHSDALADKILFSQVAMYMNMDGGLFPNPGLIFSIQALESILIVSLAFLSREHIDRLKPLPTNKVNSLLQLVLMCAALLQPQFGTEETQMCITLLSWLVLYKSIASVAEYARIRMQAF